ncbi:hypothetical protein GPECTOR_51g715 [Gonium pectorale]|uniref:BTB domain-containing protein n=1 Tax=Gonium pectorale TaxID=33097 RepID=A0A150G788_GONPE|nr:hypothetical protein GPECTOR_51g715 [Gonium pectorale]|eukprot:KXZ45729.1 hypothetical protein GPECTOR_51g715 [Gonium pectorale]
MSAQPFALQNISHVLNGMISRNALAAPGVLALGAEEDPECWAAVVQMAELRAYQPTLLKWENLPGLMRLAHTYDMPVVRAACADFISRNKDSLTLDAPLTSPKNILVAATLVEKYGSGDCGGDGGAHEFGAVDKALDSALSSLRQTCAPNTASARSVIATLRPLVHRKEYATSISAAVLVKVVRGLVSAFS